MNDVQYLEDFHRLVAYVVFVDSHFQQVKVGLGIASIENGEKNTLSVGVRGPIKNQKKSTMKFTNGREIDYKKVAASKIEGKCYFCEEKTIGLILALRNLILLLPKWKRIFRSSTKRLWAIC